MKRIKLKESDLTRLIERIIWEATPPNVNTPKAKRKAKPKPKPAKQFNVSDWSGPFTKKIDTFIGNKNFNGAIKFLKGQLATWSKKGNSAGPAWTKQLKQKSAVANKEIQKVEAARRKSKPPKKKPIQKPRKPQQSKPMMPMDGGTSTKPARKPQQSKPIAGAPKKLKESDLRRIVKSVMNQNTRHNGRGIGSLINRISNR